MKKKISVVIPNYNEEANVAALSKAITEVMVMKFCLLIIIPKIILRRSSEVFVPTTKRSKLSLTPRISVRQDLRSME